MNNQQNNQNNQQIKAESVYKAFIDQYFQSGNDIPVTRAVIKLEDWQKFCESQKESEEEEALIDSVIQKLGQIILAQHWFIDEVYRVKSSADAFHRLKQLARDKLFLYTTARFEIDMYRKLMPLYRKERNKSKPVS